MVISGVHLDASGKPIRYKVENSWGDAAGDKGYFVMTDAWFEEFVYQVVVPKQLADKRLLAVYESGEKTVLPPWDPMVSFVHFVCFSLCLLTQLDFRVLSPKCGMSSGRHHPNLFYLGACNITSSSRGPSSCTHTCNRLSTWNHLYEACVITYRVSSIITRAYRYK